MVLPIDKSLQKPLTYELISLVSGNCIYLLFGAEIGVKTKREVYKKIIKKPAVLNRPVCYDNNFGLSMARLVIRNYYSLNKLTFWIGFNFE